MMIRRRMTYGIANFTMNPVLFQYTGNYQTFVVPGTGFYKIECWGAQGNNGNSGNINCFGGYVSGVIKLFKDDTLFIYCGRGGLTSMRAEMWNGGGMAGAWGAAADTWSRIGSGGGATDVRLTSGDWNNVGSLRSRIMVAGAGGGGTYVNSTLPSSTSARAGGLTGYGGGAIVNYSSPKRRATGGGQTSGGLGDDTSTGSAPIFGLDGSFGKGADGSQEPYGYGGGGGGGYYGGGSGGTQNNYIGSGAGGSSFVSGHNGCNAINSNGVHTGQSIHFSGYKFEETVIIDGAGYQWNTAKGSLLAMPNPSSGNYASGAGHKGSGYCRISKI